MERLPVLQDMVDDFSSLWEIDTYRIKEWDERGDKSEYTYPFWTQSCILWLAIFPAYGNHITAWDERGDKTSHLFLLESKI